MIIHLNTLQMIIEFSFRCKLIFLPECEAGEEDSRSKWLAAEDNGDRSLQFCNGDDIIVIPSMADILSVVVVVLLVFVVSSKDKLFSRAFRLVLASVWPADLMRFDGEEVVIATVASADIVEVVTVVVVVVDKIVVRSGVVILLLGKLLSCCCSLVWSLSFAVLQYPYQPSNSFIADSAYSCIQNNENDKKETKLKMRHNQTEI